MSIRKITHVVVYEDEKIYQCHPGRHGFICGCCSQGDFGWFVQIDQACKVCGAIVEEAF